MGIEVQGPLPRNGDVVINDGIWYRVSNVHENDVGVYGWNLTEMLVDPDCRDGKCRSCVGGPCEHSCHSPAGLA